MCCALHAKVGKKIKWECRVCEHFSLFNLKFVFSLDFFHFISPQPTPFLFLFNFFLIFFLFLTLPWFFVFPSFLFFIFEFLNSTKFTHFKYLLQCFSVGSNLNLLLYACSFSFSSSVAFCLFSFLLNILTIYLGSLQLWFPMAVGAPSSPGDHPSDLNHATAVSMRRFKTRWIWMVKMKGALEVRHC